MKLKRLACAAALTSLAGLTLVSCNQSETEVRNTKIPMGNLNSSDIVCKVNSDKGELSMTMGQYYSQLRNSSYSVFTDKLKKMTYQDEYNALLKLLTTTSENFSSLTNEEKDILLQGDYTKADAVKRYSQLRNKVLTAVNSSVATSIYGASTIKSLKAKSDSDIETSIKKYVESQARKGITLNASNLSYASNIELLDDKTAKDVDLVDTENAYVSTKLVEYLISTGAIESTLLQQAEYISSRENLYEIADLEEIQNPANDEEEMIKNTNYLFKESNIESRYESSYKTFGTYNIIVIQYNTLKEANEAVEGKDFSTEASAKAAYLSLYNDYYKYKGATSTEDDEFMFISNEYKNELSDFSTAIQTLVTTTLEDGQYLTTPRYIGGKYVMAYHISTQYLVSGTNEQTEYKDLTDAQKEEYDTLIKDNLIYANGAGYVATNYNNILRSACKDGKLEIYDPLYEYRFENSNSSFYELTTTYDENSIFKYNDEVYTVADFFKDASKQNSNTILSTHFQYEYVLNYSDTYLDEEAKEDNQTTLDNAITTFENNENTTYPKKVGLNTFLVNSYGYDNKDDIMKYYYNAKQVLSSYTSDALYAEWVDEGTTSDDETTIYKIKDEYLENGILKNLYDFGNSQYSSIMSITLDHILINIDADGDGTPDDPTVFKKNLSEEMAAKFDAEVVSLAKTLYVESLSAEYADNTLLETLKYIKEKFESGSTDTLMSDKEMTWSELKNSLTFKFQLTVESLGNITQTSVSNFVKPFADYVKGIYKSVNDKEVAKEFENGVYYFYDKDNADISGVADKAENSSAISMDTLCETVYGYHMIVLDSYSTPKTLKYTKESNDKNGTQSEIKLVIEKDDDTKVVTYDSYNTDAEKASFNQFLIYFVQNKNNATSTLDSNIQSTLSSMYSEAITTYSSTNFQTYLILNKLSIVSVNEELNTQFLVVEKDYYKNQVISYDNDSKFAIFVDENTNWNRP